MALDLDAAVDLDTPAYDLDGIANTASGIELILATFVNDGRVTFRTNARATFDA